MKSLHPATFSSEIVNALWKICAGWEGPCLDPYAGLGYVKLAWDRDDCWGTEIEPEFSEASLLDADHRFTIDSRFVPELIATGQMPRPNAIITSPDYGNRMADQYLGTPAERDIRERTGKRPRRRSYAISLNRRVSEGSGAAYQFGDEYRALHESVFASVTSALEPGCRLALNVSDHYRAKERVHVTAWWTSLISRLGWRIDVMDPVETRRFRDGQNSELRVENEWIIQGTLVNKMEEA